MACPEWSEKLSAYLDGALEAEPAAALEKHLETCADCRQTLHDWRRLRERLRALPVPPPEAGMWRRVMHRVMRRSTARPFVVPRRLFWWMAAAACLLGAGLAWWWQQASSPPSPSRPAVNLLVGYHADTVALTLGDCPTWHLVASNELMEGE
ncbi:MAG: hypothetical protein SLRJCFUN_000153 [Candidatus Fervidibacter sp.]